MANYKIGKDCCIKIGSTKMVGMGTWKLDGITADQIETTAFTDNWKGFKFGAKDGGTISFSGLFDPTDTTGQVAMMLANMQNSELKNLYLYVDSTSWYEPCQTSGYFSPSNTTGWDTIKSYVNITSYNVSADKAGMVQIDFTGKVSGVMVLK